MKKIFLLFLLILNYACGLNRDSSEKENIAQSNDFIQEIKTEIENKNFKVSETKFLNHHFNQPNQAFKFENNETIVFFEFNTALDAENFSKKIGILGSSIEESIIEWIDTPHFYLAKNFIVLYLGEEHKLVCLLDQLLGYPIAEEFWTEPACRSQNLSLQHISKTWRIECFNSTDFYVLQETQFLPLVQPLKFQEFNLLEPNEKIKNLAITTSQSCFNSSNEKKYIIFKHPGSFYISENLTDMPFAIGKAWVISKK